MNQNKLDAAEVRDFLLGKTIFAFDPVTKKRVAKIHYAQGRVCSALFDDGRVDTGTFGFEGDHYWTKYVNFRNGETNHFYLVSLASDLVQAYHIDGVQAFLQSPKSSLD